MQQYGIESEILYWPLVKASPNVLEYLTARKIDLVINIPKNYQEQELTNASIIRRKAVDFDIPLITDLYLAKRFAEAITRKRLDELAIKSRDEYGG